MTRLSRLRPLARGRSASTPRPWVPADPWHAGQTLDLALCAIRAGLQTHRRRLWLRRAVRRLWLVAATVAVAEAGVALAQRAWPLEAAPLAALGIALAGVLALLALVVHARPTLGETALALDTEARTGDSVASALAFADWPGTEAVPADDFGLAEEGAAPDDLIEVGAAFDLSRAEARFVLRQRRDALARLIAVDPRLFRPRFDGRRALVAAVSLAIMAPALLLPNPQDLAIARDRAVRDQARAEAQRIDEASRQLAAKGTTPTDPRTRLAEELRQLAQQLRQNPGDPQANLAKLGAVEDDIRSQLDPSTEQRASALTSAARALSRTATRDKQANPEGDPKVTHLDLNDLGAKLDTMTAQERAEMAAALAALQELVTQADSGAGRALQDAASSIAQGDIAGAEGALDKLGKALEGAGEKVQQNRDLAKAASQLQDSRRDIANAGAQQGQTAQANGQGQANGQQGANQGNGQGSQGSPGASTGAGGQGQAGAQGSPGASSGNGQGGQGSPGASSGSGQGQGQGSPGASSGAGQGQGQQGQGQGQGQGQQGQGQGQGQQGQGQGQGGGSLGGGGSNATYLGSGVSSGGPPGAPTGPNRASVLGQDLSSVYAPFDRLGKPGDPSYVAGTGGDGQMQQGNQQGQGTNNGSTVPYSQVFGDFYGYALTTLDRSYVPSSVKDYVRDYFSSLDPKQ